MTRRFTIATVALLCLPGVTAGTAPLAQAKERHVPALQGRIVAVSDGDHLASTYGDGVLSPESAGFRDLVTVLDLNGDRVDTASVEASNSVTAAPEILALSADGRTAFVVERLGQRPPGGTTVRDLPPGDKLTVLDVSGSAAPRVHDVATVASMPEALAVSPDGSAVAIVANPDGRSVLQIIRWDNHHRRLGTPRTIDLAALGVTAPRGDLVTNVQWHPSGRFVAVNVTNRDRVAFVEVGSRPRLFGNLVTTGKDPFVGRFTPDGRHYLTSNWGRDLTAPDVEGRLPDQPSTVGVIRLGASGAGEHARHRVVATAPTDRSSEGLAVSPDGRLVATVNMRGTALPPDSPEYDEQASVSLLRLDPASGRLSNARTVLFDGVLPEGGTFDPSGRWFLATVYQDTPGVQIFRVATGELVADRKIDLPHGVHHVVMTPARHGLASR
ncbi:hypothetical protein ACTMTJ_09835 [Phytohabitans sp. LJ34]|uniref:hypothetical protein n=1 Tax=Phytohabitans sp. LJ34 TaxID=3452217 RepID=UPI003F8AE39F